MLRPKRTVYTEPYWFDEALSLVELHGWTGSTRDEALALPIGALSTAQLEALLAQQVEPHYLVPIAIARLGFQIGEGERALVYQLLSLRREFWETHPYLRAQLAQLLEVHLARHPDDRVRTLAASFLQQAL